MSYKFIKNNINTYLGNISYECKKMIKVLDPKCEESQGFDTEYDRLSSLERSINSILDWAENAKTNIMQGYDEIEE